MSYRKILIFKTGAIGDFIASTIAIKAIRDAFKNAHITLVANTPNEQTCPPGNIVDEFIDYKSIVKDLGYLGFYRKLKKERFDLAVNLKWNSEFFSILSLLVGKRSAGAGKGLINRLFTYTPKNNVFNDPKRHEYLLNLDIATSLGISPENIAAYVYYDQGDVEFAHEFFEKEGLDKNAIVIMAPGASTHLKAWPKERYIETGKRFINEHKASVVISWAPEDRELAGEVADQVGDGAVLAPPTKLREIYAMISEARMVVCNNSGILHMAYATQTPTVCLNASVGWAPFGERSRSVIDVDVLEKKYSRTQTNEDLFKELNSISVDQTWGVIRQLWEETS